MPLVTMPDGAVVDMPESLPPDLAARLQALNSSTPAQKQPLSQRVGNALKMDVGDALGSAAYKIGGGVTDALSNMGAPAPVAAGAGYAANVGFQAIPTALSLGRGMGSNGAQQSMAELLSGTDNGITGPGVMQAGARRLMQSAVKPSVDDLLSGKGDRAIQTMLDEGINPTRGGVDKLKMMGAKLNEDVSAALKGSNAVVDKGSVGSRIQDVVSRIENTNPTPQNALASVDKVYTDFLSNGLIPKDIPVEKAQAFKQGIYRVLKDSYGELGSDTKEAQKALARGFKEEIERVVPEVAPLNARASDIWNAANVAERRALQSGNTNILGLAPAANSPMGWASFLADKNAMLKAMAARLLNSSSSVVPPAAQGAVMAAPISAGQLRAQQLQGNQP